MQVRLMLPSYHINIKFLCLVALTLHHDFPMSVSFYIPGTGY